MAQVFAVMMAEAATGLEPTGSYFRERRAAHEASLSRRLADRYGELLPSGLTPQRAATALLALIEGIHLQWLFDPDRDEERYPSVVRDAVGLLVGEKTAG
jgi:hypothetical protein